MRHLTILLATLSLALAACTGSPGPRRGCDAASLGRYIGQPAVQVAALDREGPTRIVPPGGGVTTDYIPDRLTIETDSAGRVTRLRCG